MLKLYTVPEVAEQLDVSTRTIHRFLADGRLGHYRMGNRIKFSEKHVNEFLQRSEYHAS